MHAGIDWSNYQGLMTPEYAAGLRDLGVLRVAAQTQFPDVYKSCADSCVSAGIGLDAVRYLYGDTDPNAQIDQAMQQVQAVKPAFTRYIWLDCEDPRNVDWPGIVQQCLDRLNSMWSGISAGIYTSESWWKQYCQNTEQFSTLPLRLARWNGLAAIPSMVGFGGWSNANAIQYSGGVIVQGVNVNPNLLEDTDLNG